MALIFHTGKKKESLSPSSGMGFWQHWRWLESGNVSQRRHWKECACTAVNLAAGVPADNNGSTCETRLMSELSPRLQKSYNVIWQFSQRRWRNSPGNSAMRCPWQPQASRAYCYSIDISHSACIQSSHSSLISLSICPPPLFPQSAALNQILIILYRSSFIFHLPFLSNFTFFKLFSSTAKIFAY